MNAIATSQHNYVDVEFPKLNDIATRLRTAKAKITVKKVGTLHRIILLQQPTLASVEQILSYAEKEQNFADFQIVKVTESPVELANNNGLSVVPDKVTVQQENLQELATLEQLKTLKPEKLKQLATTHKVTGRSKMDVEKLAEKLQGLVSQSELI